MFRFREKFRVVIYNLELQVYACSQVAAQTGTEAPQNLAPPPWYPLGRGSVLARPMALLASATATEVRPPLLATYFTSDGG
jgi:hypothetical protein